MATKEVKNDPSHLIDTNYPVWEEHVKQCFYADNRDAATTAAWGRDQGDAIPDADLSDAKSRAAWSKIYSSLSAAVIQRFRGIQQVKAGLSCFSRRCAASTSNHCCLRNSASRTNSHDFPDINEYILWLDNTVKTLEAERKIIACLLNDPHYRQKSSP
jgi:hypothetical protein